MILRREFSYYLLQLYIPSCMLVIVSWVSFWLDKDSVPARVTLGVTTLLTMTTQSSGINAKLPPVSYTKAVDVWIGVCMAFIFGALLEFALVNYAARKDISGSQRMPRFRSTRGKVDQPGQYQQKASHSVHTHVDVPQFRSNSAYEPLVQTAHPQDGHTTYGHSGVIVNCPPPSKTGYCSQLSRCCCKVFVRRYKERSKRIDVVSRLMFPIGYAFFNGEYSCARVKLILRREYSYYLIQLYIPCIMLVVVSWVSFWLDKDAVPARVSLGVTTLLTMTTQASGINSKLPPVSYIKAVDVWIGVCLAFIFGALLEYALVNYYGRKEFLRKEKSNKTTLKHQMAAQLPTLMGSECLCPPAIVPNAHMGLLQMRENINLTMTTLNNNNDIYPLNIKPRRSLRLDLSALNDPSSCVGRIKRKLKKNGVSKGVDIFSRYAFPLLFFSFLLMYYFYYFYAGRVLAETAR